MNPIDEPGPETFFADVLLPLRQARLRRGLEYFPRGTDAQAASYWEPVATRTGGLRCHSMTDAEGSALLAALAEHWLGSGDADLASLLDEIEALRKRLHEAAPPETARASAPSYSAYPLF